MRSSSGQGFDTGILSTIVNSLNSNYSDADIQFSLLGSEFIDNDYYYVNFSGKENQLFGVNSHCEAIDIYVLGESTSWIAAGMADNIPSTALIIHGDYYDTSSLPHEMGHCLGLYHTHHGTVNEGGGDLGQCAELVNGDNSLTCGDYIEDTAADPNVWSSSSCTYTGTGTDANGDEYSPDASNLMSYAYKPCRILFSELQIERMKDFIDNTTILQNVFHSTISGPSLICTSGTFTVNNPPDGTTVTWEESDNLTEDPYEEGTFTANGSGRGWVEATLTTTGCEEITLPRKNIWAGTEEATVFSPFDLNQNAYNWYLTTGTPFEFRASLPHPSDDPADYIWTVWDEQQQIMTLCPSGTGGSFVASHEGYYTVNLKFNNGCGWGDIKSQDFYFIQSGSLMLQISPNPTNSETIVSIEPEVTEDETLKSVTTENVFDESVEWDIEVYDNMQSLKLKKQKLKGKRTTINTQSWKEGVYMVRVKYNDELLTGKLIVKK
nr:T9SS type A sorting domain-containing protein [uncultured Draconibacterium sp.]